MFRWYVLLFVLIFGAKIHAQQSESLTYDVEMILPEELAQFTYLTGIVEDPDGFLWMSSYKGLTCLDGHKLIHYNNQHTKDSIFLSDLGTGYKSLATNDNGRHLWTVEHVTGRVIQFDTKERQIKKIISPIEKNIKPYIFSSYEHIYAVHLIGDSLQVSSFTNDKFDPQTIDYDEIHTIINHSPQQQLVYTLNSIVSVDKNGNLIQEQIINSVYDKTKASVKALANFDKAVAYSTKLGSNTWLTDRLRNVLYYNINKKVLEDYGVVVDQLAQDIAQSTLKGGIESILQTSDKSIYILYSNSLIRLKTKLPKEEDFAEPIKSGKSITSMRQITEDDMGNIYASFYTGVAIKSKGSGQFTAFKNTLTVPKIKESTYSLTYYKDQLIWNCSVYDLETDDQSFIHYPYHGAHVNHYLEQDTLWMFFWFSNEWVKHVLPTDETFSFGKIQNVGGISSSSLEQDKEGFFWMTTDQDGILKIDRLGNIEKQYPIQELGLQFEDDYLYELHIMGDQVYFGSQVGLGVLNLNTNTTEIFDIPYASDKGKFLSRVIYFILHDEHGQLYLGTDHGLVLFDTETTKFKTLVKGHPLADKEFNRNSAYRAKDGRFYVGTVNGLYSFLPEELSFELDIKEVAAPIIYELHYYKEDKKAYESVIHDWSDKQEINLGPADHNFTMSFSSPSMDEIYYKYRVVGLQDEWSILSPEGRMDIYSLPAGKFTIELKAQTSPFHEVKEFTSLTIIKSQFWYKRPWVIALFVLLLLVIISLIMRNRYRRKLAHEKDLLTLRTKISSDLHDDVGSILGGLAIQSELMANMVSEKYKPKLSEMSDMSREAMELMRDTVWAMDPRKDRFKNLIDRMRVFSEKSLSRVNIEYTFESDELMAEEKILPNVRQNIYLIFKEAITNIVKHSNAQHVDISFKNNGDKLQLRIYDNGVSHQSSSAEPQVNSDGQGISNMKMRAVRIAGKLVISRENGFQVLLEINK